MSELDTGAPEVGAKRLPGHAPAGVRIWVEVSTEKLVAAVRRAIAGATKFDERDWNRDFDVDYEAVARGFKILAVTLMNTLLQG